jgi:NADPH-dependent curcumin reductase CurA
MSMETSHATTSGRTTRPAAGEPPTTTGQETTMQAIVQDTYGSTEILEFRDIDKPVPTDDEVLVRVRAAGLDRGVWHVMTGLPYLIRFVVPSLGPRRPKVPVRGMDLAGHVEAVGKHVTRFRPGDAVFGWTDSGSYAQYTATPEDHLAPMPARLTFEQAAAVPISGLAALQGLRDMGEITAGQKVLVIGAAGAAGGVGSFAVQLAKALGAKTSPGLGARGRPSGSNRSERTRSSTTPATTLPTGRATGTSSSTPPATAPCRACGAPSPHRDAGHRRQ